MYTSFSADTAAPAAARRSPCESGRSSRKSSPRSPDRRPGGSSRTRSSAPAPARRSAGPRRGGRCAPRARRTPSTSKKFAETTPVWTRRGSPCPRRMKGMEWHRPATPWRGSAAGSRPAPGARTGRWARRRGRRLAEVHQALPVLVGQRPQQDAADHAEDRGAGADAERQGEHETRVKPGLLRSERRAKRRSQQTGHEGSPGALARPAVSMVRHSAAMVGRSPKDWSAASRAACGPMPAPSPARACRGGSAARRRPRGRCRRSGRAEEAAHGPRPAPRRAPRSPRGRRRASARPRCGAGAGLRGSGGSTWPHDRSR